MNAIHLIVAGSRASPSRAAASKANSPPPFARSRLCSPHDFMREREKLKARLCQVRYYCSTAAAATTMTDSYRRRRHFSFA